ncbi:MAG: hypothetical protein AAF940_01625 [Pseudomonadota bacterium]
MDERNEALDAQVRAALATRQPDTSVASRTVAALSARRSQSVRKPVLPLAAAFAACSVTGFVIARLVPLTPVVDPLVNLPGGTFLLWGVL